MLWLQHFILSGVISSLISSSILGTYWPGEFLFQYLIFLPSHKNPEVVCHSLLQWATFCQSSPPWPGHLGWPHTAWLSFTELDNAVVLWPDWLVSVIMVSVWMPSGALSQHLPSYLGFSYLSNFLTYTSVLPISQLSRPAALRGIASLPSLIYSHPPTGSGPLGSSCSHQPCSLSLELQALPPLSPHRQKPPEQPPKGRNGECVQWGKGWSSGFPEEVLRNNEVLQRKARSHSDCFSIRNSLGVFWINRNLYIVTPLIIHVWMIHVMWAENKS